MHGQEQSKVPANAHMYLSSNKGKTRVLQIAVHRGNGQNDQPEDAKKGYYGGSVICASCVYAGGLLNATP